MKIQESSRILDKGAGKVYDSPIRKDERRDRVEMLDTLQELYQKYDETAARIRAEAPKFSGLWGMGADPKNHPAHLEFYNGVAAWVEEFLASGPDPKAAADAARIMLGAANQRRKEESYWYTYAAQSHVIPLIPYMDAADCKELADWYDTLYTKLERMPIQRELYKKLRKAAK